MGLNRCEAAAYNNQPPEIKDNYNIIDCIKIFTKEEVLLEGNEWYCNKCKEHKLATKKMELYNLPNILILHLKRFKTNKVNSIGSYYYTSGG